MANVETQHFELWLSHEIDLAHRETTFAWRGIDSKMNFEGHYFSGRRINACIKSIEDSLKRLAEKLFEKVSTTSRPTEFHLKASGALVSFLDEWEIKIPVLVVGARGSLRTFKEANRLMVQIREDLAVTTELARLALLAENSDLDQTSKPLKRRNSVALAIDALWQGKHPPSAPALSVKDRNNKIRAWIETNALSVPATEAALTKAVERACKDLH